MKIRIKRLLSEKTRYEKETGQKYDISEIFRSKITDHPCEYAFTMIDIPKIGINPQTRYETPAGVYCYPLSANYYHNLIEGFLPFANDKPYVGLVKLKWSAKWLKLIDSSDGTKEEADRVEQYLKDKYNFDIANAQMTPRNMDFSPNSRIFVLSYFCSKEIAKKDGVRATIAFSKLLRELGYDGVYDSGNSIIHPSEPTQLICLNSAAYEKVGVYETSVLRSQSKRITNRGEKRKQAGLEKAERKKFWKRFAQLPPTLKVAHIKDIYGFGVTMSLFDFLVVNRDIHLLDNATLVGNVDANELISEMPINLTVIGKMTLEGSKLEIQNMQVTTLNILGNIREIPTGVKYKNLITKERYGDFEFPSSLTVEGNLTINANQIKKLPEELTVGGTLDLGPETLYPDDLRKMPVLEKINFKGVTALLNFEDERGWFKVTDISKEELQKLIDEAKSAQDTSVMEEIKFRWRRYI